jgi:hypothetical protein
MESLVSTGGLLDLVLGVIGIEIVGLWLIRKRLKKLPSLTNLLPNILAGAALILALRLSLTGASWVWIPALLTLSLIAHLSDLWLRVQSTQSRD